MDRVRQALDNLLDNAIKHSDRGAPLVLTAEVLDGHVSIAVENAGESFPGWLLPRAFEPFVVGPDSEGAGAGLGLAIVRAVAVAHGGHAVAENLSGSGARVAITLATEMKSLLIGESASPHQVASITDALTRSAGVRRLIHLRT